MKESAEVKEDKAKMTVNFSALGSELRLDRLLGLTKNGSNAGGILA